MTASFTSGAGTAHKTNYWTKHNLIKADGELRNRKRQQTRQIPTSKFEIHGYPFLLAIVLSSLLLITHLVSSNFSCTLVKLAQQTTFEVTLGYLLCLALYLSTNFTLKTPKDFNRRRKDWQYQLYSQDTKGL
jgi:hypothetical protein